MKKFFRILCVVSMFCQQVIAQTNTPDRNLLKKATNGDVVSQNNLGVFYIKNNQEETALYWWTKAAEQGYASAQFNIGNYYSKKEDYDNAIPWLIKAAEQGYASAQMKLGHCYFTGKGINKDIEKALYWTEKAAKQWEPQAQYNLGVHYYNSKEYDMAKVWLNRSANQGYEKAKKLLQDPVFK